MRIAPVLTPAVAGLILLIAMNPLPWLAAANSLAWQFTPPDPDVTTDGDYIHNHDFSTGAWDVKREDHGKSIVVGHVANDWGQDTSGPPGGARFDLDTNVVHGGEASQRIDIAATARPTSGSVTQFRILPRGFYNIDVWLRSSTPISVSILLQQDQTNHSFAEQSVQVDPNWREFRLRGYVPVYGLAQFIVRTSHPGSLWVGDARIDRIIDPALPVAYVLAGVAIIAAGWIVFRRKGRKRPVDTRRAHAIPISIWAGILLLAVIADATGAVQYQTCLNQARRAPKSPERIAADTDVARYDATEIAAPSTDSAAVYHGGGIADDNSIVGTVDSVPKLWKTGIARDLPLAPGVPGATVNGSNAVGDIVGVSESSPTHAILWRGNVPHLLNGTDALPNSDGLAMNNRGQVAGRIYTTPPTGAPYWSTPAHAAYWDADGTLHDLGVPAGYRQSRAYGINNDGQIAGWVLTSKNRTHAALWRGGRFYDLGVLPGSDISGAIGIANDGWVAGNAVDARGVRHIVCWESGKIRDLGTMTDCVWYAAMHMSDNHSILIEYVRTNNNIGLEIWDPMHGFRKIRLNDNTDYSLNRSAAIGNSGQILACGVLKRKYETFDHRYLLLIPEKP